MERSSVYHIEEANNNLMKNSLPLNIKHTIMKKLANISPFLLLLVPVFIMMILTFAINTGSSQNEEVVLKSAPAAKTGLVKVANPFSR